MMRCPFSQHQRLFFRPDKVSCLIVVFLVLAALTPRRPSSAYPSAPRRRPSSSSCPSDGHHDKAAAAEHPVKAASGTAGEYNTFSLCAFHLCNSRLTGARPPPTHQSSSAVVGCVRPLDCGHASLRDHRSRAQPRECRTAAGGKIFFTVVVLSLLRSRLTGAVVPP